MIGGRRHGGRRALPRVCGGALGAIGLQDATSCTRAGRFFQYSAIMVSCVLARMHGLVVVRPIVSLCVRASVCVWSVQPYEEKGSIPSTFDPSSEFSQQCSVDF